MTQPIVNVGILSAPKIEIVLNGKYRMNGRTVTGEMTFEAESFDAEGSCEILPVDVGAYVSVKNVMIGKEFHWQRFETQDFIGDIHIVRSGENLVLINALLVEDYLKSVISSEMSATSSLELLKAHSVISRSWLLAQIYKTGHDAHTFPMTETDTERIRWYDRDDHDLFDVCADDHCQRYQGISRQTTDAVARAIEATYGEVLEYDGELCDARFSKCCGGVFEQFETCWEPVHKPYLSARADCPDENAFPDLTVEENAREWILSAPEAFCNTDDSRTISEVLNGYDKETTPDFYRGIHRRRAFGHSPRPLRHRLRHDNRNHPPRTRHVGTHQPPAHRRHQAHHGNRQGARNTPHALAQPPVFIGFRSGKDRRRIPFPRSRLGPRRGPLPDWRRRDGRKRLRLPSNPRPLLPGQPNHQRILNLYHERKQEKKPVGMDSDAVFCAGSAVCGCDDNICHNV